MQSQTTTKHKPNMLLQNDSRDAHQAGAKEHILNNMVDTSSMLWLPLDYRSELFAFSDPIPVMYPLEVSHMIYFKVYK